MRRVGQANVQPVLRRTLPIGRDDLQCRIVDTHRARRVRRVLDAFHAHPRAAKARHGPAQQSVLHDLGHACGRENRDVRVHQRIFALVAGGGRFAGVIIAHQHQHTAML
ncbi:hypothetical protein SDC9_122946 [bioreactor metagenome]|uniref:Uncharacterized protein n=1 Tax=bioreactor metagenome TaxID=1076179 RepID=A0A645CGB8_9ZZZZ